jgi:hypothetical protein
MRVYLFAAALLVLGLACGKEQEAPPQSSAESVIIALDDEHEGANALLTLIDLSTGERVGELTSGYQTWALIRPSAGELLVSDLEGDDFQGRLLVHEIANLDSTRWTLPLPDRAAAIGYGPFVALSQDERYLYYVVHPRDEEGQAQRLANRVGIVDLEARREVTRAETPGFCPALTPLGDSDVLALCGDRRSLISLTPGGSVSTLAGPLPASMPAPDQRAFWRHPVHGDLYDDGAFLVFGNGDVVFAESKEPATNLLPSEDLRLWGSGDWGSGEWHLDDGRALLAIGPTEPETYSGILLETLIVFDPPVRSTRRHHPCCSPRREPRGASR